MLDELASFFLNSVVRWDYVIGGFALFLFGIKFMGDGLKAIAGDKLRDYIDKYTSTTLKSFVVGFIITILVQSSSATTAIMIGFIRAGLMRLEQSIGIILGSNIGSTATSFLIGLKIENYALYIIIVGVFLTMLSNSKKRIYLGNAVLGFGLMFFGLKIMGDELKLLAQLDNFGLIATKMADYPLLSLSGGIVMTAIIQSSAAAIGIIQKIYEAGAISLHAALPFVFGSNIGTTVTAILAAIGGSLGARRAALIHTLVNVIGTMVLVIFLNQFIDLNIWLAETFHLNEMLQISVAHIIFNVIAAIVAYPLTKYLIIFVRAVIRGEEPEYREIDVNFDMELIKTLPSGALGIAKNNILKMGDVVIDALSETMHYLENGSKSSYETIMQLESIINSLDTKITEYLLLIAKENLSENDLEEYTTNLQVVKNLERIGDLSTNLAEFYELIYDAKESLSEAAVADVIQMYELVLQMLKSALSVYQTIDYELHHTILEDEDFLDQLEYKARQKHFDRMTIGECRAEVGGSIFVDILGTIERIGDHACNISKNAVNIHVTHDIRKPIESH
jgi:phosphate:Na+ symporter